MSADSPSTTAVPLWPKATAILGADGSVTLTVGPTSNEHQAEDLDGARAYVLEHVAAYARTELARPIRLQTTDPDGEWLLAVHPDATVTELGSQPAPPEPGDEPPAQPVTLRRSRTASGAPPRRVPRGTIAPDKPVGRAGRRRRSVVLAAVACVLAALVATVAIILGAPPATPVPSSAQTPRTVVVGPMPAPPATPTTSAIADAERRAARRAAAKRRAAADARATRRRAMRRRVAARQRAAARRAREARAAPPPPVAAPPVAPVPVAPPPPVAPTRPAPPPPASPTCKEFPPC